MATKSWVADRAMNEMSDWKAKISRRSGLRVRSVVSLWTSFLR